MDCCADNALMEVEANAAGASGARRECVNCGGEGRTMTRKTVLLMLKPECFDRMGGDEFCFCLRPDCRVVYFAEGGGATFTTDDLRVRVGLKEEADPVPLCYCFGFDERDARAEIEATGRCTIPQRVTALVRQGMCACAERNPSGACCLGEVNRTVKRLLAEAVESPQRV
jgi:hypothetical protein